MEVLRDQGGGCLYDFTLPSEEEGALGSGTPSRGLGMARELGSFASD